MADTAEQTPMTVEVSTDKTEATLSIAPSLAADVMAEALCQQALAQRKVAWTPAVAAAVQTLLAEVLCANAPRSALVARAALPTHGIDGCVHWQVDESAEGQESQSDARAERIDFYQHSAYVMVEAGQVLGQIVEPTAGEDGRDVTGSVLPAKPGKEVNLHLDESIIRDARGQLIAQIEGVLIRRRDGKASISAVLDINGFVDFSTGHIDFDGDVLIRKGIRDRFNVTASGNVEVHGLIEAATVRTGGDLIAHTGMAARGAGTATVGGDLAARYLDNVSVEVQGTLRLKREAINCHIIAGRGAEADQAAIIGGTSIFIGPARVAVLGSDAAIATTVVLGRVPYLEQQQAQLAAILNQLDQKQQGLINQQTTLNAHGKLTDPADRERQTELMFELQQVQQRIDKATAARATVTRRIIKRAAVDLRVNKHLHPGVVIQVRDERFQLQHPLRGPLHITMNHGGPLGRVGDGQARPLQTIIPLLRD